MNSRIQLLVVDDQTTERTRTCEALQAGHVDFKIVAVDDVTAALEQLRSRAFDCVLTEQSLPHGDALSLLRATRELGSDCPLIVLTRTRDEPGAVELIQAGGAGYLVKGELTTALLAETVRQAARVHHAERLRSYAQERQLHYAAQLKGLADASMAINAATSLEGLLEVLARKAAELIGAHHVCTSVVPDGSWAEALSAVHLSDKYATHLRVQRRGAESDLHPLVRECEQPLRMSVAELEAHAGALDPGTLDGQQPPLRGLLAAPLVGRRGNSLGFVQLSDKYSGEFSDADEAVLVQLARFASLSVENAHLLALETRARQRAEASARRIARLQAVTAALSRPASLLEVMNIIVEQAEISLDAEQVALYAVDRAGTTLSLRAHRNMPPQTVAGMTTIALDQPFLTARSVRERRTLIVRDFEEYTRLAAGAARAGVWTERTKAVVCLPLQVGGTAPFGTIAMTFAYARELDGDDLTYFHSLGDQWAQAFDRARLHEAERGARAQAEQAREQAETANRLKDEFLATISHELRTPLQSVLGWARLLRGNALDARTSRGLEIIERNARAQAQLIEDILDVSRIIAGKLRLEQCKVGVETFVQSAIDTLRAAAEAKQITLTSTFAPELGELVGDPDRLQQVVWNLLSNAVKFTPPGGRIDVIVARDQHEVTIRVSDSGKGIAPEFLPHVFERFRQADATTTRAHSGLGLGLAIVRHLIELHGGRVRAESEGVGRGASFVVQLPTSADRLPAPTQVATAAASDPVSALALTPVLADKRILVVDDEQDALELATAVFAHAGARVSGVGSAPEAVAKLATFTPDVIVSDISMPGEDGFSLLSRIRALPALDAVPVVALTAFARDEDRARMLQAGFALHLVKPIDPHQLLTSIAHLLARR